MPHELVSEILELAPDEAHRCPATANRLRCARRARHRVLFHLGVRQPDGEVPLVARWRDDDLRRAAS